MLLVNKLMYRDGANGKKSENELLPTFSFADPSAFYGDHFRVEVVVKVDGGGTFDKWGVVGSLGEE